MINVKEMEKEKLKEIIKENKMIIKTKGWNSSPALSAEQVDSSDSADE